jgi:hypothetical protein
VLSQSNRISLQEKFGQTWIAATFVVRFAGPIADRVETSLAGVGIETRRWWGEGAHAHPATSNLPRTALTETETLVQSTLGLPFYRDLDAAAIHEIGAATVAAARL